MRAVLHSDQSATAAAAIDRTVLAPNGGGPAISYIASKTDPERKYFLRKVGYYASIGITDVRYFDFDEEYAENMRAEIFKRPILHLAGGSTSHFLASLRRRNALDNLRRFSDSGGILVGVSAGAILLGPDICIAGLCGDDVYGETSGIGLAPFSFLPHFKYDPVSVKAVSEFSRNKKRRVFACEDGGGIVIDGDRIDRFGGVHEYDPLE